MTRPAPADCREMVLLTQAEIDGELGAAEAAAAAVHRQSCAECQTAYRMIRTAQSVVRTEAAIHAMPAAARKRLLARLRQAGMPTLLVRAAAAPAHAPWWRTGIALAAGASIAASATLLLTLPQPRDVGDAVADAHIRALQPGHLLDRPSANQHDVMPWYEGKIDFAPPVKNLADRGFELEGGRLDYLAGRAAAALVYRSRQHPIELFVWPAPDAPDSEPTAETRNGYNILHWNHERMSFWAVSDVAAPQLRQFVDDWRRAP